MNCCNDYGVCTQSEGCPARQTKAKLTKARRFLPCPEKDSLMWIAGFVAVGWLATMAVLVAVAFTVGYFVG